MTFQPPYKGCSDGPRWGYGDIQMANIIKHHAFSKWDHASSFIRQKKNCECAIMETALYAHFLSSHACPYCSMSYISMYFKGSLLYVASLVRWGCGGGCVGRGLIVLLWGRRDHGDRRWVSA